MADISANESIISTKDDKNSTIDIIDMESLCERDIEQIGTSFWRSEDVDGDCDSTNRRFFRQQAKSHMDRIVEGKLEDPNLAGIDNIDEALDRISRERQLEREQYKAAIPLERKNKRRKKRVVKIAKPLGIAETIENIEIAESTETVETVEPEKLEKPERLEKPEPADNRLDIYMDRILDRIGTRLNRVYVLLWEKAAVFVGLASVREAWLSDKMAVIVERVDLGMDNLFDRGARDAHHFIIKQREGRAWCENHKRQLLGSTAALAVLAGSVAIWVGHITAYEYMYNGKVMGIVKDQRDVFRTIDIIGDKLTYAYGAEITIDKEKDISFRKVIGMDMKLDDREDVLNQFTYLRDMNATAYAINVDGQQKAVLYSKKCAEKILDQIQSGYLTSSESVAYESIGFEENIEVAEINTKIGNIQKEEDVLEYMLTGAVQIKTYSVKSGDTFNQIAKNLGLTPDDLLCANPGVDPAKLQIGQELILNKACPVLTVRTTEIAEYTVPIDYEITYEETTALYKGEQTIKSSGIKGERQVVAQIIRNNGEEVGRNELSSEVITEPKAQVVLKGAKDLPPLIGTGSFIYPTRGTLTSRFGTRWGRMHNGIDLAASTGTKIRAADGGKVISAGWEGALGYCVRIDHGQNKVTVYGHCSKLFVKKGDRVYQDQHIANIGNTGRSTGPHLHFEVHINGVPQNPLKYLP